MINVLPPEAKRQIRAGQSNVLLLRYCIISGLLAGLLFGTSLVVYFIMQRDKGAVNAAIQESATKSARYAQVQQEVDAFSRNLATAKAILSKDVRYSKLAISIAQALPSGIVLQSLTVDAKTFGKPMALSAKGRSYDDAIRLKTSLESSPLFTNVHLQQVTNNAQSSGQASPYPVTISISVTIPPEVLKDGKK